MVLYRKIENLKRIVTKEKHRENLCQHKDEKDYGVFLSIEYFVLIDFYVVAFRIRRINIDCDRASNGVLCGKIFCKRRPTLEGYAWAKRRIRIFTD